MVFWKLQILSGLCHIQYKNQPDVVLCPSFIFPMIFGIRHKPIVREFKMVENCDFIPWICTSLTPCQCYTVSSQITVLHRQTLQQFCNRAMGFVAKGGMGPIILALDNKILIVNS